MIGPKLFWLGVTLIIVGPLSAVTIHLGPMGKVWWPDGPLANPRRKLPPIGLIMSAIGLVLLIVGLVVTAKT
jgi:hypothetical protein